MHPRKQLGGRYRYMSVPKNRIFIDFSLKFDTYGVTASVKEIDGGAAGAGSKHPCTALVPPGRLLPAPHGS